MPTPTEYQKHLLFIIEGQLVSSSQSSGLLQWLEGKKSYHSPLDKIQLIDILERISSTLEMEQRRVKEVAESLKDPDTPKA